MSLQAARKVLEIERDALVRLLERLSEGGGRQFERAVELILACQGRVILTGMGKSGIVAQKIAATFASTGTPALFLHPGEAAHGDLGILVKGDVLIALSYGGETEEVNQLLPAAKRLGIAIVALTGNNKSTLAQAVDVVLDISVQREACSLNLTPTASTTAMVALGDALAIALLEVRGFKEEDFARLHPRGRLGRKLQRVETLMHTGDGVPRVLPAAPIPEVIYEMSRKGLGMTTVVEAQNKLVGIVTDGDLRRLMQDRKQQALDLTAGECMTKNPATIFKTELAWTALGIMEQKKITCVIVVDKDHRVEGVLHLHDLWTTQFL